MDILSYSERTGAPTQCQVVGEVRSVCTDQLLLYDIGTWLCEHGQEVSSLLTCLYDDCVRIGSQQAIIYQRWDPAGQQPVRIAYQGQEDRSDCGLCRWLQCAINTVDHVC